MRGVRDRLLARTTDGAYQTRASEQGEATHVEFQNFEIRSFPRLRLPWRQFAGVRNEACNRCVY